MLLSFVHVKCVFNTVKERGEATEAGSVNACPACAARASGHVTGLPVIPLPIAEEESSEIEKILGRRHHETHAHRVYLEVEAPPSPPASPTEAPGLPVLAGLSLVVSPSTVAAAGVCI